MKSAIREDLSLIHTVRSRSHSSSRSNIVCLMHFYQSIHTVWARSTLTLTTKLKDILRGAMTLSVRVSGRCESHFLLSRAQIIAERRRIVLLLRYDP